MNIKHPALVAFFAWDQNAGAPKTGDAANLSVSVSLDGAAGVVPTEAPVEVDSVNHPGIYSVILDDSMRLADVLVVSVSSTTVGISIAPTIMYAGFSQSIVGGPEISLTSRVAVTG